MMHITQPPEDESQNCMLLRKMQNNTRQHAQLHTQADSLGVANSWSMYDYKGSQAMIIKEQHHLTPSQCTM